MDNRRNEVALDFIVDRGGKSYIDARFRSRYAQLL